MTMTKVLTAVDVDANGGVNCIFYDTSVYYASLDQLHNAVIQASSGADSQLQMLLLMLWMQDDIIGRTALLDTDTAATVVTTYV